MEPGDQGGKTNLFCPRLFAVPSLRKLPFSNAQHMKNFVCILLGALSGFLTLTAIAWYFTKYPRHLEHVWDTRVILEERWQVSCADDVVVTRTRNQKYCDQLHHDLADSAEVAALIQGIRAEVGEVLTSLFDDKPVYLVIALFALSFLVWIGTCCWGINEFSRTQSKPLLHLHHD